MIKLNKNYIIEDLAMLKGANLSNLNEKNEELDLFSSQSTVVMNEAFKAGSSLTVITKMLSILGKRIGEEMHLSDVNLEYSNEYGNFSGYMALIGNASRALRINFILGKSDRIASIDYYEGISETPDVTIEFDYNDNIIQIVNATTDVLNGVRKNPLYEKLEERSNMGDATEAITSWIMSDQRTNEDLLKNTRLSNLFNHVYRVWARDNNQPPLSLPTFMKVAKTYLEDTMRADNKFLYNAKIKKGSSNEKIITSKDEEKRWLESMSLTVNEKFQQLDAFIDLLVAGHSSSIIVAGRAGIGKSFSTLKALDEKGIKYVLGTGSISKPNDLFKLLWKYSGDGMGAKGEVIVFDDLDVVLKKSGFFNLLKGALDMNSGIVSLVDKEFISRSEWKALTPKQQAKQVPSTFQFHGKIIFLTNMILQKVPSAVLDRGLSVDMNLSAGEVLSRIQSKIGEFPPDVDAKYKLEAFEWLVNNVSIIGDAISFRSFEKIVMFASTGLPSATWGKWALNALSTIGKQGV